MSRLEKAREEKKRRKKISWVLLLLLMLIAAAIVTLYILDIDDSLNTAEEVVPEVIDLERSIALIDIFDLTYVRIYTLEDQVADEIRVNGEPLERTVDENRWEITLPDLQAGNEILVVAIVHGKVVQEESLIIEDL